MIGKPQFAEQKLFLLRLLEFFEAVQEATCLENGIEMHKCKYCDHTEEKELPPLGHQLDDGVKDDGFLVKSCTRDGCEYKEFEEIIGDSDSDTSSDSNNDSSTDSDSSSDSSSDTNGSSSDTETEVDPDDCEHDWQFVSSTATCTKDGVAVYACSICYEMMSSKGDALGHDMQFSYTVDPTCAEGGYDLYRCSRGCGETEERNPTPVTSIHTWAILDVDLPTCEENGLITFECSVCFTEKDSTYEELANGLPEEQVLAETIMALGHDFSVLSYECEPTCLENGYKIFSCSHECGKTETRVDSDSLLGHLYINSYDCSRCDYSSMTPSEGLKFYIDQDSQTCRLDNIGSCSDTDIVIPYTYSGLPVVEINSNAFSYSNLTSVTVPSSVSTIGSLAFANSQSLKAFNFHGESQLSALGNYAFRNCSALEGFEFPSKLTRIPQNAFESCLSLTKITIPNNVTTIGDSAFTGCEKLLSVTIGEKVTSIENCAFYGCTVLEIYNLSELSIVAGETGVDGLALKAFAVHDSLDDESILKETEDGYLFAENGSDVYLVRYNGDSTALDLPTSYNGKAYAIFPYAFNKSNITKVIIPAIVTEIGSGAFSECPYLSEIFYNASELKDATSSDDIFKDSGSMTDKVSLIIGNDVLKIPQRVFSSSPISSISFEAGGFCQEISKYAFSYCTSLTSVTIPNSVRLIGEAAFAACKSLSEVKIGSGVSEIGYKAFYYCIALKSIVIPSNVATMDSNIFQDCDTNLVIYCEAESIPEGWNSLWCELYNIYWYSANEPLYNRKYWHYVDGTPTPW